MLVSVSHCCSRRNLKEKKNAVDMVGESQLVNSHMADNILKLTGATVDEGVCYTPTYNKCMFLVHGFTANGMDVLLSVLDQKELHKVIAEIRGFKCRLVSIHIVTKDRLNVIASALLGDLKANPEEYADHAFPTQLVDVVIADLVKKSVEIYETDNAPIVWYLVLNGSRREIHTSKPKSYMKIIGEMYAKRADIFRTINTLRGLRHTEVLALTAFKEQFSSEPYATAIKEVLGPDFRYDDLIGDTLKERAEDLRRRLMKAVKDRLSESPRGSLLAALMGGKDGLDDFGDGPFGTDLGSSLEKNDPDGLRVHFADMGWSFDRSAFSRPLDSVPPFRRTEPVSERERIRTSSLPR